jgi:hypothetical protein
MFQTRVVEEIKTHIFMSNNFFENFSVYEKMWKKAKCIVGFPLQQWLHKRATMLHCMYIAFILTNKLLSLDDRNRASLEDVAFN